MSRILTLLSLPTVFAAAMLVVLTVQHAAIAPIEEVACVAAATGIVVLSAISQFWYGVSFEKESEK